MPMNFPDLRSLKNAAKMWKFREIKKGELEEDYRRALADYVASKDFIESEEIRNKVGWDQWNDIQKMDMLNRKGFNFNK